MNLHTHAHVHTLLSMFHSFQPWMTVKQLQVTDNMKFYFGDSVIIVLKMFFNVFFYVGCRLAK